ncbi:MAG: hypothetical protein CM15mP65_05580 [Crocinitomicaceae bacterium]|nr:MAG: hypothetical protein CM15mP65_05580 [Crocinitomicaceae bacterium]
MQYPANGYGLFDMAGNVWEICADWFDDRYYESFDSFSTADNPTGPETWYFPPEPYDPKRVVRGGSFYVMIVIVLAIEFLLECPIQKIQE